jgi:hypothetical protein
MRCTQDDVLVVYGRPLALPVDPARPTSEGAGTVQKQRQWAQGGMSVTCGAFDGCYVQQLRTEQALLRWAHSRDCHWTA